MHTFAFCTPSLSRKETSTVATEPLCSKNASTPWYISNGVPTAVKNFTGALVSLHFSATAFRSFTTNGGRRSAFGWRCLANSIASVNGMYRISRSSLFSTAPPRRPTSKSLPSAIPGPFLHAFRFDMFSIMPIQEVYQTVRAILMQEYPLPVSRLRAAPTGSRRRD